MVVSLKLTRVLKVCRLVQLVIQRSCSHSKIHQIFLYDIAYLFYKYLPFGIIIILLAFRVESKS
jgi:hypothetical protein